MEKKTLKYVGITELPILYILLLVRQGKAKEALKICKSFERRYAQLEDITAEQKLTLYSTIRDIYTELDMPKKAIKYEKMALKERFNVDDDD